MKRRKKAGTQREPLVDSPRRWRALCENLPDIVMTVARDGSLEAINRTVKGLTVEQAVGTSIYDYISPEHRGAVRQALERVFETGKPDTYQIRGTGPLGPDTAWYETRVVPVWREGRVVAVTQISTDVTARKEAEDLLRDSEQKYRQLVESVNDGIWALDEQDCTVFVNPRMAQMLGYGPDEMLGRPLAAFLEEGEMARCKDCLSPGRPEAGQRAGFTLLRKDGTRVRASFGVAVATDDDGNYLGATISATDITERELAAEAIRKSEEEFRLAFENAKDAIFWADPETGILLRCNKAAEALLGRSRDELVGMHQTMLHPPETVDYHANQFRRHFKERGAIDDDGEIITKSGQVKPVHISASLTSVGGKTVMQGIFRDITERKEAERQLEQARSRLAQLVDEQKAKLNVRERAIESSLNGIGICDLNGIVTYANPAFAGLFGCDAPEEVLGWHASDFSPGDEAVQTLTTVRNEGRWSGVLPGKRKDGSAFDAQMLVNLITDAGRPVGIVASILDVTEQRQMLNALVASEQKYRQVVENTQDIVYSVDREGRITFVSPAVTRYGYAVSDVVGRPIGEFLVPEDLEPVMRDLASTLSTGAVFKTAFRIQARDGRVLHMEELGSPIRDLSGEIAGITGVIRDVTEQRQAEEALRKTNDELVRAERLAAIGEMATGISHEINQPLTAMRGYTDNARTLISRGRYEEAESNLRIIAELLDRSAEITGQLKLLVRRPAEPSGALSLRTVVENVVSFLAARAGEEGVRLLTDVPAAEFAVRGDLVRLEQVVMNLVGNALDAMKGAATREVRLALRETAGCVALTCRDTGSGIPADRLRRVFEPFYTTKPPGEGLGLGLAIAKTIVEECGGNMTAANHPDGGAVFTVTFPPAGPATPARPGPGTA